MTWKQVTSWWLPNDGEVHELSAGRVVHMDASRMDSGVYLWIEDYVISEQASTATADYGVYRPEQPYPMSGSVVATGYPCGVPMWPGGFDLVCVVRFDAELDSALRRLANEPSGITTHVFREE